MNPIITDIHNTMLNWEKDYEEDAVNDNNISPDYREIINDIFVALVKNDNQFSNSLIQELGLNSSQDIQSSYDIEYLNEDENLEEQRELYYAEAIYLGLKKVLPGKNDSQILSIAKQEFS